MRYLAKNSATSQGARSETNAINRAFVSLSSLNLFRYFFWLTAALVGAFAAIFKTFEIPADDASTLITLSPRPQNWAPIPCHAPQKFLHNVIVVFN